MQDHPPAPARANTLSGNAPVDCRPVRTLPVTVAALLLCFSVQIFQLVRFALGSDLYSHVILIPFVSAYLVWLKRDQLTAQGTYLARIWPAVFISAGAGLLILFFQPSPTPQDSLALAMYSLVLMLAGICYWLLNRPALRAIAFPLVFLLLMAPLPTSVEVGFETFLQHGSSIVAQSFFQIIGTPVFREGTLFHLPGFNMQVAPECSGIHSTVALFITSLVAGQVLLRSNWSRTILALIVIPIALLRNGLRVTVIGELCVHLGPEMINSFIHVHGGPIFFVLSLIPFAFVLFFLLKIDRKNKRPIKPAT